MEETLGKGVVRGAWVSAKHQHKMYGRPKGVGSGEKPKAGWGQTGARALGGEEEAEEETQEEAAAACEAPACSP